MTVIASAIPVARLRPIVEQWLLEFETSEDAFHRLATSSGFHQDSWRKRFTSNGWWAHDAIDSVDVDAFLTAADLAHLWHTELADLLPDLPPFAAEKPKRPRKKPSVPKRLGEHALRQMHLLHERRYVSIRQISLALHEQYGYPNDKHMTAEISRGWKALDLKAHGRIEMTVRASTTNGLSPRNWNERKRRRLAAGLTQKGKVRQPICKLCARPVQRGSLFCFAHNPDEGGRRDAIAAYARSQSPLMNRIDLEDAAPLVALLVSYQAAGGSWRALAQSTGIPEHWLSHVAHGKQARVAIGRAEAIRAALTSEAAAA